MAENPGSTFQGGDEAQSHTFSGILRAARRLFLTRGYEGTSVADIAKDVGITPGAIYWHFKSKTEVLATVLEDGLAEFRKCILGALTGSTPTVRLYQLVTTQVRSQLTDYYIQDVLSTNFVISQLADQLPPSPRERIRGLLRAHLDLVEDIIRSGVEASEFRVDQIAVTALAVINLADSAITWFRSSGPLTADEIAHIYGLLALRMVGSVRIDSVEAGAGSYRGEASR